MKRICITYRDPLTNSPCVRWFLNLVSARKFIRKLCFIVPYKITLDNDNEWRGCYNYDEDVFIEFHKIGRIEYDGGLYDDKDL